MVRVSGVNSQSSIDIFSKYLASLALGYDDESVCDFGDVKKYVGDVIYSKEYNIYYLFEENRFLLRDVSDKTVLKKSSLIATPEEMERYFNKIVESLPKLEFSTKYIQKCKDKAEDFLTNTIRFTLEKFIEYLFEDEDPYTDNFEITYESFFNIPEYFSEDININPNLLSDERLSKLFNLNLLGDHFISNKLNDYLNDLYIGDLHHKHYDFMFFLKFLTLDEVVGMAQNKMMVGQFINEIIQSNSDYENEWFFNLDDFNKQSIIIAKKFPSFLEEVCKDESLGHLISVNHYYRFCHFSKNKELKNILSCSNYGIDWCKRILNSLSSINDKMQKEQSEHELVYNAWKRLESIFMDDISEYNKELLEGDPSVEDNARIVHPKLINLVEFIVNHKNLDELRLIYQTKNKEKIINIGSLPDKAFDVKFENIYIKSYITYPKDLPIIITGFENVDITQLENRLGFYCDAIYCNNKSRKLIVPKDEIQVWKDFEGIYNRGMIKSIMWNEELTGFVDSILEQNK